MRNDDEREPPSSSSIEEVRNSLEMGFRDFAESIVQHIDEVFFWRDADRPIPYFVSHAYERIWGRTCASVYATPSSWIESIYPEDRDRVMREFERAGTSEQTQVEYRIVRSDGDVRWIWSRTFPILDEAGGVKRLIGIAQDCTERKQAEETRAFLASIVESSDDCIISAGLDGTIRTWNRGAQRLLGYTPEEAIGENVSMLFLSSHQRDYLKTRDKISGDERIERFESVRVAKGGAPIDVSVIISPVKDESGCLIGMSGIFRDIGLRKLKDAELLKAKEAAEAANRSKNEFLANISHEIRTPMNGIIGLTEVVLDSEMTAQQREYLGIVKQSAESLLTIINDILDFSKIEALMLNLERHAFELRPAIGAIMQEMSVHADKKGLALIADVRPEAPDPVYGDRARLRQVLVNLIGNAIKFTDKGRVAVHVKLSSENRNLLHFEIQDTGIGIPTDMKAVIFNAFTQIDSSSTRKFGGTGLGLAIAARLVEMMEGRIWVESDGHTGSTFHFTARLW
jgi:two-component system sensor histidine kinase/response regulator